MYFKKMMKMCSIWATMLTCCILTSCREQTEDPTIIHDDENTEVVFRFQTNNVSSFVVTRGSSNDSTETGTAEEDLITSVILYFYDAQTKSFSSSFEISDLSKDGEKGYVSKKINIEPGTYDIFAICNSKKAITAVTEDQLLANIDADTYSAGVLGVQNDGFVMTNRATSNLGQEIKKSSSLDNEQTIEIAVERCVARIEVAKNDETYELTDDADETYAYVKVNGYYFLNLATSYYSFRHVAELTDLTEPAWSLDTNFGETTGANGYVCDPYFFKKTVSAAGFNNPDGFYAHHLSKTKIDSAFSNLTEKYEDNRIYALENCTFKDAQKHGYSTGIVFKSVITPADNVYDIDSSGTLSKVEAGAYSKLYFINYKFYGSINALIKAGAKVSASMTEDQLLTLGIKTFKGTSGEFDCYYKYWIRHIDDSDPTEMVVMEFAIVRNNLYRMKVTGVSGLGSGNIQDDPNDPNENETNIQISFNVKPWIVRKNDIIL